MFQFNTVNRVNCYRHDVDAPGLDHCYDCRAEVFVFEEYIKHFDAIASMCNSSLKSKLIKQDLVSYVLMLNKHLEADKKMITLNFNQKAYRVKFLDVKYGKTIEEVCTTKVESKYKSNWTNWNRNLFDFGKNKSHNAKSGKALDDLKKRLSFSSKRLQHGPSLSNN